VTKSADATDGVAKGVAYTLDGKLQGPAGSSGGVSWTALVAVSAPTAATPE
jgi:hypothetical protein